MNILTFDIEEWFHHLDNGEKSDEAGWDRYEVRIYENVERIFRILEDTGSTATFFIIGWIARTYPDLVRRIAEKYEIGNHTACHRMVWQQTPEEFREDVHSSNARLEDIIGRKVEVFRAPGFSIRESEKWAFEILAEEGIRYDCSVFPAGHAHGGMPSYPVCAPSVLHYNGISLKEFPMTTTRINGKQKVFSGGGYFRMYPYFLIRKWTRRCPDYLIAYLHPRDLDPDQPRLDEMSRWRRFKFYYGLKASEGKLRSWLTEFPFTDLRTAASAIDWSAAPQVYL